MQVWLNGQFVDRDNAKVSVFDAGFQHGVGLFETMLARNGKVFRVESHVQRLAASARELFLTGRLHIGPLIDAINSCVRRNELEAARVRLTVTGGDLNMLQSPADDKRVDPTILIVAQTPTRYPESLFDRGVMVMIADGRENPLHPMAGHKTINYWPRIRALQIASSRRAGEALWFSVSNHLSAGCVSNVLVVKDGRLRTPIARGEETPGSVAAPVLPGITRAVVIESALAMDIKVDRTMLDINDVLGADEVMLTNSSWGVLPVTAVENAQISTGQVGPMARRLRQAWADLVEKETREQAPSG